MGHMPSPTSSPTVETKGGSATLGAMRRTGRPTARGWFITVDGPDGGGKTTQAERIRAHLERLDIAAIVTREPGGTWLGERIREVLLARTGSGARTDALTDALLFNAARRQLVREVIRPALERGTSVVCARFADSTIAYQGFGGGVSLDRLRELEAVATDGLRPDLTILLDVPVDVGLGRKAPGDVTRFEAEFDLAFHQRVREGFLELARTEPGRFAIVDATRGIDAVAAEATAEIDRRLLASEPRPPAIRTQI